MCVDGLDGWKADKKLPADAKEIIWVEHCDQLFETKINRQRLSFFGHHKGKFVLGIEIGYLMRLNAFNACPNRDHKPAFILLIFFTDQLQQLLHIRLNKLGTK